MIAGCTHFYGPYEADPLFEQQSDLLDDKTKTISLTKLKERVDLVYNSDSRNQLLEELLTISDRSCARHQASIIAWANAW